MHSFIILGYGIPESIEQDENYPTYLRVAFNRIFASSKDTAATIIPCGGNTNCTPPYAGNESVMIGEYIQKLISRSATGDRYKQWSIVPEDQSISSLENLVFAKRIIDEVVDDSSITIFCEATRADRIRTIGTTVFGESIPVIVEAIDFDVSENRYLDAALIQKREAGELKMSLWALESPDKLAQHHQFFERKFELLRSLQDGGMSHIDAIQEWYSQAPMILEEVIPDYSMSKSKR